MKFFRQYPNFLNYWLSSTFSAAASNVTQYAISLYILDTTGSAAIFSTALSIIIFPRLMLSPIAGVLGDRWNRKKSLVGFTLLSASLLLFCALLGIGFNTFPLWLLFTLMIILELIEIFSEGPTASIVPSLVHKDDLAKANTWMQVDNGIVNIATPFISALIYTQLSITGSLLIASILIFITAIGFLTVNIPPRINQTELDNQAHKHVYKHFIADFKDGLRIIRQLPNLKEIIFIACFINLFLSPAFSIVMNYFTRIELQFNNEQLALVKSFMSLLSAIVPILLMRFVPRLPLGKTFISTIFILTASVGLMWLTAILFYQSHAVTLATMTTFTLALTLSITAVLTVNITISTFIGQLVPETHMGRVVTLLNTGVQLAIPIGQLFFGFTLEYSTSILAYGIMLLGMIGISFLAFSIRHTLTNNKPT